MENTENQNRPISDRKIEANRRNAQKSTGPRTGAGKARSSQNSYKHGFFASRMFPGNAAKEEPQYREILEGLRHYYQPSTFMEDFFVERLAIEMLRYARLLGHEQMVATKYEAIFYQDRSAATLLRYLATVSKQMSQLTEQLEKLQATRRAGEEGSNVCGTKAEEGHHQLAANAHSSPALSNAAGLSISTDGEQIEAADSSASDEAIGDVSDANVKSAGMNPPSELPSAAGVSPGFRAGSRLGSR